MLKNRSKILIISAFAVFYLLQASLLAGEYSNGPGPERVKFDSGEIGPDMDDETESDYSGGDYDKRERNEEKNSFQNRNKNKIAKKNKKIRPDKGNINKQSIKKSNRVSHDSRTRNNNYTTYSLVKGDTLYGISKKYNIPLSEIRELNNIDSSTHLPVGFKLKIQNRGFINKKSSESAKFRFRWPLKKILSVKRDGLEGIKPLGIIITSSPSSSVISSAPGIVKKIGFMRGFGRYIVIKHSDKYLTVYSNMNEIIVREGDRIDGGGIIGKIDQSDRKLHFQINFAGKAQDPLRLLPKM